MTNYTTCCCGQEVVGWDITSSHSISIASTRRSVRNDGGINLISYDVPQTLAIQLRRVPGEWLLQDVGSDCSGVIYQENPFWFKRETLEGFIDLNDESGQTYGNGSPILRTPATLATTQPLFSFDWPTGGTVYDFECLGLVDPTTISLRRPTAVGRNLPFEDSPYATLQVSRETNQFGQTEESNDHYRYTPIIGAQGSSILVFLSSPLPSFFPVIMGFKNRLYRDLSSFGQFDLEDIGMDDGITELPFGFDADFMQRYSSFQMSIDGQDISQQELLAFGEDVLCKFRTGQTMSLSYVDEHPENGSQPFEFDVTEYDLTMSMNQSIDSLEYVFA